MDAILLPPDEKEALLSPARQAFHDDLRRGWHVKGVIALHSQARIAKAFQDAGPLHHETFGQLVGVVDPLIYEEMKREHGPEIWRDKEFRDTFFRRNAECRIESKSGKTALRVDGLRIADCGLRIDGRDAAAQGANGGAVDNPQSAIPNPQSP